MDNVLEKLASALGRREEEPNIALAEELTHQRDVNAIQLLVDNLTNNNKKIQNDCIKVLYEIGASKPDLIAGHLPKFIEYLNSKNNRLQWGAMTAIATIADYTPGDVYGFLPQIIIAANQGSVITRDQAVEILIKLCQTPTKKVNTFDLLMQLLAKSALNQLPMYAEKVVAIVNPENKNIFLDVLKNRIDSIEKESKRKRIEKVLRLVSKIG
jgi:hypothetical protein